MGLLRPILTQSPKPSHRECRMGQASQGTWNIFSIIAEDAMQSYKCLLLQSSLRAMRQTITESTDGSSISHRSLPFEAHVLDLD